MGTRNSRAPGIRSFLYFRDLREQAVSGLGVSAIPITKKSVTMRNRGVNAEFWVLREHIVLGFRD